MADTKFVKVATAANEMEGQQLVEVLQNNNIAAYYKGGSMDIYMGVSLEGGEILVPSKEYEAALEVLSSFPPFSMR